MGRASRLAFIALNGPAERESWSMLSAARRFRRPCKPSCALALISCRAVPEVTPGEAKQLIDSGAQLVDVRDEDEYAAGRIPGSRHVPLETVHSEAGGLDRERPLVVYCRSGERSAMAADAFAASGWQAHSIAGGLLAWADAGLPLEPEGGSVAERSGLPPA
jgi:rhodanese-related sulfurtransferase